MNIAKKISFMDVVITVLSLCFLLGLFFVFTACGPGEDGSFMTCHWAGEALKGMGAVLAVLSLLRLFIPCRGVKMGISLSMAVLAVLMALTPGRLINMCMMKSMRCHSVMKPGVLVFSVLTILLCAADIWMGIRKSED